MALISTPVWNEMGVIPPVDESDPTSHNRSPYQIDIIRFTAMFALTPARVKILQGFLEFRKALYAVGMNSGFQWLDGSFSENVELIENRPPNDIDVVTFYKRDEGVTDDLIVSRNPALFDHDHVKSTYFVDSYFQPLQIEGGLLVSGTVYWYSMWSHKRDRSWKGFLNVPLSPDLDSTALTILNHALNNGGEQ
ncbi:DUF6932 family protein [Erwinia aphidicola]|uniref:DUF6932 family protein n=1 Tax=Erwinia aphidicola TaxID=68334 RepID=UPI003D20E732